MWLRHLWPGLLAFGVSSIVLGALLDSEFNVALGSAALILLAISILL